MDPDGAVRDLNDEAMALFCAAARNVVGRPFESLFPVTERPAIVALVALARTEPTRDSPPSVTVTRAPDFQGASWVEVTARRISGRSELFAVVHDVTSDRATRAHLVDTAERCRRAQDAMSHAVADRERLLAVVSHDLRNPLGGIMLGASILERALAADRIDPTRAWAQAVRIRRAAERMEHLIDDLLDLASVRAGRITVDRQWLSPAALFDELFETVEAAANHRGVRVSFCAPEGEPRVHADRDRLLRVLSNLVGNALKFTPAGGEVVVMALPATGGDAILAVQDTGPGIEPELRERLFGAYERGGPSLSGGHGLGLFICRGIIEAHGGRMWLDASYGPGARFCMLLPGARQAVTGGERSTPSPDGATA